MEISLCAAPKAQSETASRARKKAFTVQREEEDAMTLEALASHLEEAGWKDFSPGEFLGVTFEAIGKAKLARNNWFALLKSIPQLDEAALDAWGDHYAHFWKKTPARMFSGGKYFVLILLVETITPATVERLASRDDVTLLDDPEEITRGGGYPVLAIRGQQHVLMPRKVVLWEPLRAKAFAGRTHKAVVDYLNGLLGQSA
jgi:hypothetical protein